MTPIKVSHVDGGATEPDTAVSLHDLAHRVVGRFLLNAAIGGDTADLQALVTKFGEAQRNADWAAEIGEFLEKAERDRSLTVTPIVTLGIAFEIRHGLTGQKSRIIAEPHAAVIRETIAADLPHFMRDAETTLRNRAEEAKIAVGYRAAPPEPAEAKLKQPQPDVADDL